MLGWLKRMFASEAPKEEVKTPERQTRMVRARYDAAQTSPDSRRHWANADHLSVRAAHSPEVRRTLRSRARYEVENNSYARGIVETLANDVIGTGPRLQLLLDNQEANRFIEAEFSKWSRTVRQAEKLRTMRKSRAQDGEAFAVLISNPALTTPVQLDLRLVEADQVTSPAMDFDASMDDGITFDKSGNPVSYTVMKHHPGDTGFHFGEDYETIQAASVLHWFRQDRPGQTRGVPDITPALPLFAQLRRFTLATIAAAETAADFAAVLKSMAPPGDEDDAVEAEPWTEVEIEMRAMTTLPAGYEMQQFKAEHPATTYEMFKREIITEIARCLNMPYNVAAGDSSRYNYASGRLDHQTYYKSIYVDQDNCEQVILSRLFMAWLDEALLIPGYLPRGLPPAIEWPYLWFWDGQQHVDPQKEANAQETRLRNHTTTLADEYARVGLDWEAQLRQRAKEQKLITELGLTSAEAAPPARRPVEELEEAA